MPSGALATAIPIVAFIGFAAAFAKLWTSGLLPRYRFLGIFLIFRVVHYIPYFLLSTQSEIYYWYFVSDVVLAGLTSILTVRELFGLILERHKGLYTLGRWVMYAGVVVAGIISVLTMLPEAGKRSTWLLKLFLPFDRGFNLALLIFLVLMMVWLSRYPVHLSRNIITHACLYTAYFLGSTLGILLIMLGLKRLGGYIDLARMAVAPLCAWLWCFLLSAKGEEVQVSVPRLTPDDEERLLYKLDTLNATLLKATHK